MGAVLVKMCFLLYIGVKQTEKAHHTEEPGQNRKSKNTVLGYIRLKD